MSPALALLALSGCLWGYYGDDETGDGGALDGGALDGGALDGGADGGVPDGGADGGGDGGCDEVPYYPDVDGDTWGGAQAGTACEVPEDHVGRGGDCDDGDGAVHPDAAELCDDHRDNDCDPLTGVAECRLGALTATDAALVATTNNAEAELGDRVELCGDLDGDGVVDLVLGARASSDSQKGSVWMVPGGARGTVNVDSDGVAWRLRSESLTNELGAAVSCGGDVVGDDGATDLFAAAPKEDGDAGAEAGRVVLHAGPFAGTRVYDAEASLVIDGAQASLRLGNALDSLDWSGDGRVDLAAGGPGWQDDRGDTTGAVFLFTGATMAGRSAMDSDDAAVTIEGDQAGAELGARGGVRLADLTGDGVADLLLGADRYDASGATAVGRVWVLPDVPALGAATVELRTAEAIVLAPSPDDELGFGAALAAGDLTGDGVADLVVLAASNYLAASVYDLSGRATGASLTEADAWTTHARGIDGCGGAAADARGDLDGDGAADLVYDAFCSDVGATDEAGIAWGFYGPLEPGGHVAATDADFSVTTEQVGARLGRDLSTAGDVDGDGRSDLLVGAYQYDGSGRALLFLGTGD